MSAEETSQPSAAERAARQAAGQAAARIAKQALAKLAAVLGAKGAAVVAAVIALIALVVALVVLIAVVGAGFQTTTAVWPVPIATDAAGNYQASGWAISSRYGWRDDPQTGDAEFHDGIDLANPNGACPFGYHCGAPSIFDGTVQYVGWDAAASGDPSRTGGGELVIVANGAQDHQTIYAHLEPYRLYVQLQGRIDDDYGRYDDYTDYQPIGHGPLRPDLSNGALEMTCVNDMPNFIPTRSGAGTVVFLYDRPASCTTTVVWGQRGGDWRGWIADQPGARARDEQRAELHWQTPIHPGQRAQDVALRFRAHLVPPPPPPPITDTATLTPVPAAPAPIAARGVVVAPGQGAVSGDLGTQDRSTTPAAAPPDSHTGQPRTCETLPGGWTRCSWSLNDIPTERERFASMPDPWIAAQMVPDAQAPFDLHEDDSAFPIAATPIPGRSPTAAGEQNQWLGIGGLVRQPQVQTIPTAVSIDNTVAIDARLPERLILHAPDRPELLGPVLTITSHVAEELQITARYEDPAMPGPNDQSITTIEMPAGTLTNYVVSQIGVTVAPDTAPGVQACLSLDWRGLTSGTHGSTRACTITADPQAISPTTPPAPPGDAGSAGPDCAPEALVRLPNLTAPNPQLIAPAAASFAAVRAEIVERTGVDALAILADVLRAPSFTTSKAGVLATSWHKAGRAVDLNQSGPFLRVAEGRRFRLYVNNVDITTIFEAHGWQRIPVQGDTAEWWHYEWHPDGIAWTSAMLQVWDRPTLQAAFPEIAWATLGCAGGSTTDSTAPSESEDTCVPGAPRFSSAVEAIAGCGPPVRAGDRVYQLDSTLGFVGLSGRTSGPHLHLGLKVKSYDGSWPFVDICTPEWLQGRAPPADATCFTDMADPLAFLPQAPGNAGLPGGDAGAASALGQQVTQSSDRTPTPIIPEGAPYQLPPPNYPNALVFTPVPNATPIGQYWSPYADGGQYGGGSVGAWFCSLWSGWPWCT